jgi:hypothetical protein
MTKRKASQAVPHSTRTLWTTRVDAVPKASRIPKDANVAEWAKQAREASAERIETLTAPFRTPVTDETLSRSTGD